MTKSKIKDIQTILKVSNAYDRLRLQKETSLNKKITFFLQWTYDHYKRTDNEVNGDPFLSTFRVFQLDRLIDKMVDWYEKKYPNTYFENCLYVDSVDISYDEFYSNLNFFERRQLNKPNLYVEEEKIRSLIDLQKDMIFPLPSHIVAIRYVRENSFYNGLMDTVMYKLILYGGKYYGPKRAMMFAKEFNLSMDIAVQYGSDDVELVQEYLDNGGNKDLICYYDYFNRKEKNIRIKGIPLYKIMEYQVVSNEEGQKIYTKQKRKSSIERR